MLPASLAAGPDHNYILKDADSNPGLKDCGQIRSSAGPVDTLTVRSTAPGVQFYTGNWIDGIEGKGGRKVRVQRGREAMS